MGLSVVILAAGQGTRMASRLPKVLHRLGPRSLLEHVIATARELAPEAIHVVHGHGGDQVRAVVTGPDLDWVEQAEQLGTGHAVAQALPNIPDDRLVLVLYGDVPLITCATLQALVAAADEDHVALLTAHLDDPTGYGRILRGPDGLVSAIVEQADATPEQRAIHEINTGFMALPAARLKGWIARLSNDNAQGEYYLTDVIGLAVRDGVGVRSVEADSAEEVAGVNTRAQLAALERAYQRRQAEALMAAGVSLRDPARLDVRGTVKAGRDVVIDVNVVLEGDIELADGCRIGPNCVLRDVRVGADTEILAHCYLEGADIGSGARVGPFTRIRPGTRLADRVHLGNFVEVKNSEVGDGSKINHLSYIGDTTVGARVNIGAGTITCNYDGANKHRTVIEDDVFVGSDCQLIAPVTVGRGATLGAGTTLTQDAPPGELTLGRAKQVTVKGWKRPVKK